MALSAESLPVYKTWKQVVVDIAVVLAAALTADFVVVHLKKRVWRDEQAAASVWRSLQTSLSKICGPCREAAFSAFGCIVSEKLDECNRQHQCQQVAVRQCSLQILSSARSGQVGKKSKLFKLK